MHQVAAVELGGHVHGQLAVAQRAMRGLGVGRGGGEVAAHREEHLAAAVEHRLDRADGVEAVFAWRIEAEYLLQPVEEGGRGAFEDAHRAVALHVAVPAHWAGACARPAEVAAQQQQVRSEEHTSELQSLMRNSYAVFCLKKKKHTT